jgi:hypothetical protein
MQLRSYFLHLITYNTMVKMEFKMDIICVRLIVLKFVYCVVWWCGSWCGPLAYQENLLSRFLLSKYLYFYDPLNSFSTHASYPPQQPSHRHITTNKYKTLNDSHKLQFKGLNQIHSTTKFEQNLEEFKSKPNLN